MLALPKDGNSLKRDKRLLLVTKSWRKDSLPEEIPESTLTSMITFPVK